MRSSTLLFGHSPYYGAHKQKNATIGIALFRPGTQDAPCVLEPLHRTQHMVSCPPPIAAFEEFAAELSGYEKTKLSRETKPASNKKSGAKK
jgi:hypothetical protein